MLELRFRLGVEGIRKRLTVLGLFSVVRNFLCGGGLVSVLGFSFGKWEEYGFFLGFFLGLSGDLLR